MPGRGSRKVACDLCCDSLEKGQDILKCEGDCGCSVHRYCAGVTTKHYEELTKNSSPYICQWCTLKTTHAIIQQLQSEVASLKLELAEAKAQATQRSNACPPLPTTTYATAAALPPRQPSTHSANRRGKKAPRHLHSVAPRPVNSTNSSSPQDQARTRSHIARVRVEGARRIWNTYIHTSTKSIENAISRFCKLDLKGLRIKRKTRSNDRTGKLNWWFVIHGEESMLCELESSWDALQTQTSWVLETCTKPATDSNISSIEEPTAAASNASESQSHGAQECPGPVLEKDNSTRQEQSGVKENDHTSSPPPASPPSHSQSESETD